MRDLLIIIGATTIIASIILGMSIIMEEIDLKYETKKIEILIDKGLINDETIKVLMQDWKI